MTGTDVVAHELAIRLGSYLSVFAVMATWELFAPRRTLTVPKSTRWWGNLALVALNALLLRLVSPAAALGMAWSAHERGWGLLNNLGVPFWLAVAGSVVALDFVIYVQHVLFHAVPALWRLHMVHHADLDLDVTTGTRFHPLEMVLSLLVKLAAIALIGPPVVAVLLFEVVLNATAVFNHSNVRIPLGVDRWLRWLVVTPDMHRVHHSVVPVEVNSNFGFNLPWWDRLLGTYVDEPAAGHERMTMGLRPFRDPRRLTLPWMLALPFVADARSYSFGHPARLETTPAPSRADG